ncbi:MAG: RluA family pseudouridine synthase [Cyclobacteriaceae bacterium]|nr:RluA family pseudouridine synthase [Cyclobacteriaceae bacterium]
MSQPLSILYEDNHLLVINKASGVLVQGDETGDKPLVEIGKEYIKVKYGKPGEVFLGVVHRLDRPVSGVVVFARTSKALARMNELFRSRETEKIYWAITDQRPSKIEDTLVHWLRKDEKKNKTTAFKKETTDAQHSELSYRLISRKKELSLIEVRPITGRPHQIRVQLSSIGCPILGDLKYGSELTTGDGSIGLHARSLSFIHPVKKELMKIEAPVPNKEWWNEFGGK